jgi:membrane associated rhomboid family serine protease
MFMLWMFGRVLESVWGSQRFFIFYIVCGLGAAFLHSLVNFIDIKLTLQDISQEVPRQALQNLFNSIPPVVGASGAVYGILLGFGMLFPNTPLFIWFIPIPIKAKYVVIGMIVLELYLGFQNTGGNIAHFAHLGGALFGYILIKYWNKKTNDFY